MASPVINGLTNWRENEEEGASKHTFIVSPARSLLLTSHAFSSPNHHSQRRSIGGTRRSAIKFDIISYLPPEIAVEIFQLLSPLDLCRVCVVCQRWNSLAQLGSLARTRRRYVRQRRELYSENKENTSPSSTVAHTPHTLHTSGAPLARPHTASPLNTIQASFHQVSRDSRTPSPTPSLLEEDVGDLHLAEHPDIRRCLFPFTGQDSQGAESIGKRNKYRLKRL